MPTFHHTVPDDPPNERIDAYALRAFAAIPSRKQARKALKAGELTCNGNPSSSARFVKAGDVLTLTLSDAPRMPVLSLPLTVVYCDQWLAVVHKPAGIHVRGNHKRTLHRALRANLPISDAEDALPDPDPVHRIDFRTTGLVMVARTAHARAACSALFEHRQIQKRYRAIVVGHLTGAGRIEQPVGGREAISRYRALSHSPSLHCTSLTTVDLFPETGRTHQLRRHMAAIGHPILGDDLYHNGKIYRGNGLFLCATSQQFAHPITGEPITVSIDEPHKFDTHRRRETRRWQRHNGLETR